MRDVRNGVHWPVAFASKLFNAAQRNWTTDEQDVFAVKWALRLWRHMLVGRRFTIETDHRNLLFADRSVSPKVTRAAVEINSDDLCPSPRPRRRASTRGRRRS